MTDAEKEDLFYDFVKHHQQLEHLRFGEPVEGQQWIGVLSEGFTRDDGVVIDPNWDGIYEDYVKSLGKWDASIEYISSKISDMQSSRELADFVTKCILERLKLDNIQSTKVYVNISNNWDKTWFDSIEEV
jgi:hypothetical protein